MFLIRKTTNIISKTKGEEPKGHNFPFCVNIKTLRAPTSSSNRPRPCRRTGRGTPQKVRAPSANSLC